MRVLYRLASLALAGILFGCGAGATVEPPRLPDARISRTQQRREEPPVRLVAPPPAYGNKIVMAEAERAQTVF
jgi:hypothetical protein